MARFFIALVLCASLFSFAPAFADLPDADFIDGMIRLQVIAKSDSNEDQAEKLLVRDRVRAVAAQIVRGALDDEDAYRRLIAKRAQIERAAGAKVEIRETDCPVRIYGRIVVPAGRYRTVRVSLGQAKGRNWWCVLYPGLCGVDALETQTLESDQPVVFYSEIMRWVEAMKGDAK